MQMDNLLYRPPEPQLEVPFEVTFQLTVTPNIKDISLGRERYL